MPNLNNVANTAQGIALGPIGSAAVGAGMGLINNVSNLVFGKAMQKQQLKGYEKSLELQNNAQLDLWNKTNYEAQVSHMNAAGINPALLYGMSGSGGATTGGGGGMPQGQQPEGITTGIMGMLQASLLDSQRKNIDADTANKQADTAKKGLEGKNIDADTQNKILDAVVKDYLGQEAAAQFKIKSAWRSVENETYGAKMEAEQATAKTLYDQWVDGTLENKSKAEVQSILLANAKSDQERKNLEKTFEILGENLSGLKLDNFMKGIEAELQKKTGLDRNSPWYLKILGRLLMGFIVK